ncbi:hypothetical protein KUTeg_006562 [Tegillarca granosa]|uniref:SWIM-type domain-containing protein n=1 Tax=Tegillarca granosa TaxID=220873 RepID=A0ABQ9FGW8_TEGGR|nr:hypothetical protein KUTeg_006562 [Tegillarca granosa]
MYAGSDVLRDISKAVENSILPSSSRSEIDKILKNKTLKWDDKIDGVPKLSLGWVTNYLTGEPASKMSTHDQQPDWSDMHRRVLDRADGLFNAGKVTRVLCSNSEADDIVNVKCTCGASMKQQTYTVMLQFLNKRTPVVESAHCTCLAGLSQKCGHVGALLLALLECQKKGYSSMSCTSRDPSWPAPASKKTESCQVSDLVIEKKSVSKTPRTKEFGREHEGDAADALMQHVYEEYGDRNIVLYHSGLVINPLMPFLAASPDRILYIEGEGYFVVELKSSLKSENLKQCPTELADASNYYLTVDEEDTVILDREHNYYFQVLGQMAVCNLKKAFFGVWSSYGCHIEQIEFDQVVWDECYEKLQSFYTKHYMKFVNSQ